jgi:hypothetical protein
VLVSTVLVSTVLVSTVLVSTVQAVTVQAFTCWPSQRRTSLQNCMQFNEEGEAP